MASSMLATLECPICLEVPIPPIYQCTNGHIFCSNCLKNITACAICQEQLPRNPIRCLMAEQMAEALAKQISKSGQNKSSLTKHSILLGLTDIFGFEEIICKDQIVSHMKEHQLNGVNGNKADVIQELEDFTSPQSWLPVYFEAYDEIFFLLSCTKNDLRHESSLVVSWICVMVGDALAAKNFCLQLCLTNGDKDSKILFKCPVFGIKNHDHPVGSQFSLPFSQLKQFGKYSGAKSLGWTINVQIGKISENANGFQIIDNTAVPEVKTCSFALKPIAKPSSSLLGVAGNSKQGYTKVFLDLAYDKELIGRLVIELRNDVVPLTAENFRCLCTGEKGFGYKGTSFYYINVRNCMCGGDVTKEDGTRGKSIYGDTFKHENFSLKHNGRGILSMYGLGKKVDGAKFIISLREHSDWDGIYVVFGKVVEGMKVLDDLEMRLLAFNIRYAADKKTIVQNCGQLYD